jgi:hypothetical protein
MSTISILTSSLRELGVKNTTELKNRKCSDNFISFLYKGYTLIVEKRDWNINSLDAKVKGIE